MYKVISVRLSAGIIHHRFNLFVCLIFKIEAIGDVITNRAREENRFLLNDCNLAVVPFRVKFLDVSAVKEDFALLGVVESLYQGDDRRLTTSTCTAESNNAIPLVINLQRYTLKDLNIVLCRVSELCVPDFEAAIDLSFDCVTSGGHDGWHIIHKLDDFV